MKVAITVYSLLFILMVLVLLNACARPKIQDVMPPDARCKATIKMPEGMIRVSRIPWHGSEGSFIAQVHDNRDNTYVDVEVRIFDCH